MKINNFCQIKRVNMKSLLLILMSIAMTATAFSNPLLEEFKTPYGLPPFDKIKIKDYLPAVKEAIKIHQKEIDAIIKSKDAPTFSNVIEAMDRSGELLTQTLTIFYNLNSSVTNEEMQKIAEQISPLVSAHSDEISMNKKLFEKIKAVWDNRAKFNLTQEQTRLLEKYYNDFKRNGALLNESDQAKLKDINSKLSLLTLKFGNNVQKETIKFKLVLDKKEDLEGLPQSLIDAAAADAKAMKMDGKWVFTLQNPSVMPFLQYSAKRELREKIWRAYADRANNNDEFDNKEIIRQIANLRLERAKLLGYPNHASYILEQNMAKNPEGVMNLLNRLWEPTVKTMKIEAYELQSMIYREGNNFKLEPWDWRYYAEKVRKEKYDLNEEDLRPYFKLENVRDGIFELVKRLYGLTFKERKDLPLFHPDVIHYQVLNADGSHLGILYMDYFPRDSKRGGAWMTNYREQFYKDGKKVDPNVSLTCNFSKPTPELPSLLTLDEVETFFHEFGHCLHGLFSNCNYVGVSGTNVPRDFVELPSQIMEHWATERDMLKMYARHYKTGEPMPDELIQKIDNSSKFNQGFVTGEFLAAALLDMNYHTITEPIQGDINEFENNYLAEIGLIPEIISRYRSTYFRHIFSGGYDAGYYSYIWSGVLDADAFEAFKENGIFDTKTAQAFRQNVLEKGNTDDPAKLYRQFRGKDPSIEPLLKKRGLN